MDVTKACLTVVAPKDHPQYGKSFPIKEKQLLGSGNCAIKIKGTSVELNHLELQARQGVIMLKNLAPQESTKVLSFFVPQGRTIILMENDLIELGNIKLRLSEGAPDLAAGDGDMASPLPAREEGASVEEMIALAKAQEQDGSKGKKSFLSRFKINPFWKKRVRKAKVNIARPTAFALERLIAVGIDFFVAVHAYQFLLGTNLGQKEMELVESTALLDIATTIGQFSINGITPMMDPALLVGVFWCWILYIAWRLATTFIFGVSFGQLFCGISAQENFIWNRIGGMIRVLLEGLTSVFLLGDLPPLFGMRTVKEILTSTRLGRRSWRYLPLGMAMLFLLVVGLGVAPLFLYPSVFPEMSISNETFGQPEPLSAELAESKPKKSERFKFRMVLPEEKNFVLLPSFEMRENKGKKTVLPELWVYDFARGAALTFRSQEEFSLQAWVQRMTRGQFFYPLVYPELLHSLAGGEMFAGPNVLFGQPLQDEIKTMIQWSLNQDPVKLWSQIIPPHPLMASGYMQGLAYFDENIRGPSLSKMRWSKLGQTPVMLLYRNGMKEQTLDILPVGTFKSQHYQILYPKASEEALKAFMRDFLGRASFNFQDHSKFKKLGAATTAGTAQDSEDINVFTLIDSFAERNTSEVKRHAMMTYLISFYHHLGQQLFAQIDKDGPLKSIFLPGLTDSLDSILMVIQLTSKNWPGDYSGQLQTLMEMKQAFSASNAKFFAGPAPLPLVQELKP